MLCFVAGLASGALAALGIYFWNIGRHRNVKSLTKYVAFSIAVLIVYAVAEMVISTVTGVSHDTLSTVVFATFGGEILSCALIKIFKLKGENDNERGNF